MPDFPLANIPTPAQIEAYLASIHGAGSWEGGGVPGGDPWLTLLPGIYTGAEAGKIIAKILDKVSKLPRVKPYWSKEDE